MLLIPKTIPTCYNPNLVEAFQANTTPKSTLDMVILHDQGRKKFYNYFTQIQQNPDLDIKFDDFNNLKGYLYTVYDIYEQVCTNSGSILDHKQSNVYYSTWVNRQNTQVIVNRPSREVTSTLEVIFSKMTYAFGMLKSLQGFNQRLWSDRKNFASLKAGIIEILNRLDEGSQRIAKLYYARDVVWSTISNGEVSTDIPELNYFVLEGILL